MDFHKTLTLRGPNIWTNFTALEAWVDVRALLNSDAEALRAFEQRLSAWMPCWGQHECGCGVCGERREGESVGKYLAHMIEHVALSLQRFAEINAKFSAVRETATRGLFQVVVEYEDEKLGRACLNAAREVCHAAWHDLPFDVDSLIERLRELAHDVRLGPSTRSIVNAAVARGIPFRRLNDASLIQFGLGARQRRIMAAETDRTSAIAESIAQDKELTKFLLREVGVPVPAGRPVENAEDAWEAAQEIGGAVVVKPQCGNKGRGVATNLTTREQVVAAYEAARAEEATVIVEKYAPGSDWRLLVIGDKLVAAACREPAHVIGDGTSTVRDLIDGVNRDPRRSDGHATSLSFICVDDVSLGVLESQGFTPDSVPPPGHTVLVRRNANLSTGGTATDVTDQVHPDVAARAVEAARVVGLDIAGVDVVALDISRPLEGQGGVIVEVNAAPGLRMHLEPSAGKARAVGEAVINMMFSPGQTGRIPIVGVTGTNGKTTTTRLISHVLRTTGVRVGMTCTDGTYINGRQIDNGDCSGPQSARCVLAHPHVDAAVLETARGGILRAGLGFDLCDVAVVTNIAGGDHLGQGEIHTPADLARVKSVTVRAVSPDGSCVLNAHDPLVVEMEASCPGGAILFAREESDPVLQKHRDQGKPVVFVRHGAIIAADREGEIVITTMDKVPLTHHGQIPFQVENALAATAACWALALSAEQIATGLATFTPDLEHLPGRFNLLEIRGATVVVDYGHNPSALQTLLETLCKFTANRRLALYSAAGDRRDGDLVEQGKMLGMHFDSVVLYEDHYKRGRKEGEIISLFREGVRQANRDVEVHEVLGALKAVDVALQLIRPGDLLLLQADEIEETVNYMRQYVAADLTSREVMLPGPRDAARADIPAVSADAPTPDTVEVRVRR